MHGSDHTVTVDEQGMLLSVTGTTTITLLPVATANTVFPLVVLNSGTSVVTVDGNAAETVNGVAAIYLGPGESAILACNGALWNAVITRALPNRVQSKATSYVVLVSDVGSMIQFTAAATLTLPAAATAGIGFRLVVLNRSAGPVIVDGSGAETINGVATLSLASEQSVSLFCDGAAWIAELSDTAQLKHKAADETVNNSVTLQDDDHLAGYVLEAGRYYRLLGMLHFTSSLAAKLTFGLSFSDAPQKFLLSSDAGSTTSAAGGIAVNMIATEAHTEIRGYIKANATTGGTMKLQWAQTNLDATDTKMLDASWIKLEPM